MGCFMSTVGGIIHKHIVYDNTVLLLSFNSINFYFLFPNLVFCSLVALKELFHVLGNTLIDTFKVRF